MPQIIRNYRPKKGGCPPTYPWKDWLERIRTDTSFPDKRGLRLTQGRDFNCHPQAINDNMRKQARRAGFKVSIFHDGESITIFYAGKYLPRSAA